MTEKKFSCAVIVACLFCWSCGYDRNVARAEKGMTIVQEVLLSEFVYVGDGTNGGSFPPLHGPEVKEPPSEFEVGRQYIFHHRGYTDSNEVFSRLLRALESQGVEVLEAKGVVCRYIGDLGFRVRFKVNGCEGDIFNTLDDRLVSDESLAKEWGLDDYVLTIHRR